MTALPFKHLNPQKHKLLNDFRNYQYSAYVASGLKREEVLERFGGLELFKKYHLEKKDVVIYFL